MPIIALLTDYGTQDIYAGVMKGVIWSICPEARIADLTHDIPPQDITAGALSLWGAFRYFPSGTIFCAVVDPGVGTQRRAIAVQTHDHFFVGPDNGLLWWAISEGGIVTAVELRNPAYFLPAISPTFHGRDIFAPVAAYLAKGVPISEFGSEVSPDELVQLPPLRAEVGDRLIVARVIHIDRFGNAITNLREEDFSAWAENLGWRTWRASLRGATFEAICQCYADAPKGTPLLLFNSYGLLEVAVNQGNAAQKLGIRKGDLLEIWAVDEA